MLPIIVAGSRPAVAGLAQSQHFDCDTSADLHRLRRASITETARSRVSFASTVRLNPIGSYRLPHPHQPNRHRARRTASRIPSRDFLLWRFANAGPQAAEFAATSVTGRHPKTFTEADMERRGYAGTSLEAKRFTISPCHHTTQVAAIVYGQPGRSSWFARECLPQC
jgi:hypothetical protein